MGIYAAFYGKLPAHGDFVDRNVAVSCQSTWHDMLGSPRLLDGPDSSARCFLTGPSDFGAEWRVGTVIGSSDKVGRDFPFAAFVDGLSSRQAIVWGSQISAFCLDIALQAQVDSLAADTVLEHLSDKILTLNETLVRGLERWVDNDVLDQNLNVVGASGLWWWQKYAPLSRVGDNVPLATSESQWDEIDEFAGLSDE